MMMRILNPLEVLNLTNIKIKGLSLYIEDEILNENSGVYIYDKKWKYSKKVNDYDLKINIADLSSLLTGFFSFNEMILMKKIELKTDKKIERKKLSEILKRKQNYLYEFQ